MKKEDKFFLGKTIVLARKAEGKTSPNPLVGAIIVKSKKIISTGFHQRCGGPHAEVIAIKKAARKAKNATLYVNLEPCTHFGRTPPCTKAIIDSGIRRVVLGMIDPNPLNKGKGVRQLQRAGLKVELAKDDISFKKLNEIFVKYITREMPFVIVKVGQSLDGKIATRLGASKWITNDLSRLFVQRLRDKIDAIVIGVNTVIKDNPYLSCRYKSKIKPYKPIKIVVDTFLKTPPQTNIFSQKSPAPTIIATTKMASQKNIELLAKKRAEFIFCPRDKAGQVDLKFLMKELVKRKISSVLVEGGGELIGSFFDAKLVDRAYFFIAPIIIGGWQAAVSVAGEGIFSLQNSIKLDNVKITQLKQDILVEGKVRYGK